MHLIVRYAALVGVLAFAALAAVRYVTVRRAWNEPVARRWRRIDVLAAMLAFLATGGLATTVDVGGMAAAWAIFGPAIRELSQVTRAVIAGVWLAVALFVLRIALEAAPSLYEWATRRPLERMDLGTASRFVVAQFVGMVVITVPAVVALMQLTEHVWAGLLVVGVMVAMYPLFDYVVQPWFLFVRRRAPRENADDRQRLLTEWTRRLAVTAGAPPVEVVTIPGTVRNAFAVGVGDWQRIVLGAGLFDVLTEHEIHAIIAHEVAHVARRDVRKLLLVAVVSAVAFTIIRSWIATHMGIHALPVVAISGMLAGVLLVLVPGWFSQRIEFGADALAARLLEDPESLCSALLRLAEVQGNPADAGTVTHPPTSTRVAAIRALAT